MFIGKLTNPLCKSLNTRVIFGVGKNYNPYINYSWSQTLTVEGNQQIKDTGTSGLNLQQFFGQGCWFNGIDMQVTIPVNATIQTEIKRVNGVVEINTNTQNLTNYNVYSGSGAKVYKDLYMFNRALTTTEIEKYNNQPNQFFMDSLEDSSCILAMPMCEKNNLVRNYKNNTDYPITNYLTTCRKNAQILPYGLQTSGFKRDSNGLILSKSNFLEADGVGYGNTGWVPSADEDWSIEWIGKFNMASAEQAHGTSVMTTYNRVTISISTAGTLFSRCGGTIGGYAANQFGLYNHLVLSFSFSTKTFNLYRNGNLVNTFVNTNFIGAITSFVLASQGGVTYLTDGDTRLFKVHQKALTQEEVTKNFNKYQAQGLLNE